MHRRHFLVKQDGGDYKLREIEPKIAEAITLFGTITGQCYSVESIPCTFYFMNSFISNDRADQVAEQLTQEFLAGGNR